MLRILIIMALLVAVLSCGVAPEIESQENISCPSLGKTKLYINIKDLNDSRFNHSFILADKLLVKVERKINNELQNKVIYKNDPLTYKYKGLWGQNSKTDLFYSSDVKSIEGMVDGLLELENGNILVALREESKDKNISHSLNKVILPSHTPALSDMSILILDKMLNERCKISIAKGMLYPEMQVERDKGTKEVNN